MSGPKKISFDALVPNAPLAPEPVSAPEHPDPARADSVAPAEPGARQFFAKKLTLRSYHPVVLIGSTDAGKTALVLSLLAYFRSQATERKLTIFFGEDLFDPGDIAAREASRQYFHLRVADYLAGRTSGATRVNDPFFIPVKVSGAGSQEFRFAFMESNGELIQPKRNENEAFIPPFNDELVALLRQFPEGISFIWVAPHIVGPPPPGAMPGWDAGAVMQRANESLVGALSNYEALRRQNSARDTHLFLVTKWDTYVPEVGYGDVRATLSRDNDPGTIQDVDNFIHKKYTAPYATFLALPSPLNNKAVFRYSAGAFVGENRGVGIGDDILQTYPRDVWNWLYKAMQIGHEDWDLPPGDFLPLPPKPIITWLDRWDGFVKKLLG